LKIQHKLQKHAAIMNLAEYFEKTAGRGVLATANADGKVDVAYYARPHVIESETVAFIMKDRRSHIIAPVDKYMNILSGRMPCAPIKTDVVDFYIYPPEQ
jgi:hypothetical protein